MTSAGKVSIMCSSPIIAIVVTISIIITTCSCCGSSPVAFTMTTSSQRSCVVQDAVLVTGGGIDPAKSIDGWLIKFTVVEGKRFGEFVHNYLCKLYLDNNFEMVEHIRALRNQKVYELMRALKIEDDPNGEHAQTDDGLTMPRRELVDRLPAILTINVTTIQWWQR